MISTKAVLTFVALAIVCGLLTIWILYGFVMEQRGFYGPGA